MIEKFIYKFVDDLCEYNNYNEQQIVELQYTFKVILYELTKLISTIIIFSIFGYFKEVLLIIFVMSITKPFIGGYHEDTHVRCFIVTLLLVFFIVFVSKYNTLSFSSCIILNLITVFSIYNKAPVLDDRMPITREDLIKRNRVFGISTSLILSMLSIILYKITWLSQILVWTILVQAILMFNKYREV